MTRRRFSRPATVFALAASATLAACETHDAEPIDTRPASCAGKSRCITTVIGTGRAEAPDDGMEGWRTPTYTPQDQIVAADGRVFYLDWNNHMIRVWDPVSDTTKTIAGTGEIGDLGSGGPALQARLNHPTGLAFDPGGHLIVAAWHNSRIKRIDLGTGVLDDICGTGGRSFGGDGVAGGAKKAVLDLPTSVAFDSKGNTYISDQANMRIRKVDATDTISTVVGSVWATDTGAKDGAPKQDADGNFVNCKGDRLADKDKNALACTGSGAAAVCTVKLGADGKPTPFALPVPDLCGGFAGDGGLASAARLSNPTAAGQQTFPGVRIHVAKDDTLYIADTFNHRVRRVDAKTGVIETIAGTGTAGNGADGAKATEAQLNLPVDVDVLADGTVLVVDKENHCVRAVKDGKLSTFAGQCGKQGFSGDGDSATKALLNRPYGVAVAADGKVYVADSHNHRIRVVTP